MQLTIKLIILYKIFKNANYGNFGGYMIKIYFARISAIILTIGILWQNLEAQIWNPSISISYANIQQLSPSQIDFQNLKSSVWLFTIKIIDPTPPPDGRMVHLDSCKIIVVLRNGKTINLLEEPGFGSEPFELLGQKTITNLDFGNEIKIKNFKLSDEGRKNIIEPALASGKFPSGNYIFKIGVYESETQSGEQKDIELNLESYSQIELRYPRDEDIANEFPLFEWYFDGSEVEVTINEKQAGVTREEAINKFPVLYHNTFYGGQSSFQYPAYGVRPLEKGKTYVWRVIGKVKSLGGDQFIFSPIYQFKIEDQSTTEQMDILLERIQEILKNKYQNIANELKSENMQTTGNFYINGEKISASELQEIIDFLLESPDNVIEVSLK